MPIRGRVDPMPKPGREPTGIFSTNGRQKKDPVGPNADMVGAKQTAPRKRGGGGNALRSGEQGKKHQPPKRKSNENPMSYGKKGKK